MAKQVDITYGNALFELALEENKIDSLYEEATALVNILEENVELLKLLNHPQISKEDKIKVIEDTFGGRVSKDITGLMVMVVEKGHAMKMTDIFKFFIKLVKNEKKIGVASVTSAITLDDSRKEAIEKRLIETTKYETMEIDYKVDESLIGGLIIRIEDRVVDSSIKTKLNSLSKALSNA